MNSWPGAARSEQRPENPSSPDHHLTARYSRAGPRAGASFHSLCAVGYCKGPTVAAPGPLNTLLSARMLVFVNAKLEKRCKMPMEEFGAAQPTAWK